MSPPLWSMAELTKATGGTLEGKSDVLVNGISIDTRTIGEGDLFVALQDVRDGHDFVTQAFGKGAAVALVKRDYEKHADDGLLLRVDDPLQALEKMAVAARARLGGKARVVAVTGSAGKTTTKEMLRVCFSAFGKTHASEKSYNNHWGVPLTLARMPRDTQFAVIEIGMNHPGEIRPLVKMASPHLAMITSVLPVHLEHFSGIEDIAEAKSEIFEGLISEGYVIIPADSSQMNLLVERAEAKTNDMGTIFRIGETASRTVDLTIISLTPQGSTTRIDALDGTIDLKISVPGRHNAINATMALVAWFILGPAKQGVKKSASGLDEVLEVLASMKMQPVGRGQVFELTGAGGKKLTLIDESYNANPASMSAAFENLSLYPENRRKLAVLGDMLELGETADELHAALAIEIERTGIDKVFACGPHMKALFAALDDKKRGAYAANADELKGELFAALKNDDIIMVKGSNGSRMATLVEALKIDRPPLRDGGNN